MSDYISDQLRAQSAALRNSIGEQARLMVPMRGRASAEAIAAGRAKREAIAAEQLATAIAEWEAVDWPCETYGIIKNGLA